MELNVKALVIPDFMFKIVMLSILMMTNFENDQLGWWSNETIFKIWGAISMLGCSSKTTWIADFCWTSQLLTQSSSVLTKEHWTREHSVVECWLISVKASTFKELCPTLLNFLGRFKEGIQVMRQMLHMPNSRSRYFVSWWEIPSYVM